MSCCLNNKPLINHNLPENCSLNFNIKAIISSESQNIILKNNKNQHKFQTLIINTVPITEDNTTSSEAQSSNLKIVSAYLKSDNEANNKSQIENYTIERSLAKNGKKSDIFLVKLIKNNDLFAMKILNKSNFIDKNNPFEKLIFQGCPYISNIHGAFFSGANFYLILEYIPNGELFEIINKFRPLSEDVARFLISEIICGLQFFHKYIDDSFYRLLNIDNILFDFDGHLRISNFGLSKQCKMDENKHFSPPEQIFDKRSDFWVLGAILKKMLGNRIKIKESNKENYSRNAFSLIEGLMNNNPEERFGWKEIRNNEFFKKINWKRIERRKLISPILINYRKEKIEEIKKVWKGKEKEYNIGDILKNGELII